LPRHPSQLYEAALEGLLLFIALFILARRESIRLKVGTLSGTFLIGYAIARIIGEQFREPEVALSTSVTLGQWYSVAMLVAGIVIVAVAHFTTRLRMTKLPGTSARP
jgi:phosphatidylglycerol---prolipoprotein diacylglyceryl transferase